MLDCKGGGIKFVRRITSPVVDDAESLDIKELDSEDTGVRDFLSNELLMSKDSRLMRPLQLLVDSWENGRIVWVGTQFAEVEELKCIGLCSGVCRGEEKVKGTSAREELGTEGWWKEEEAKFFTILLLGLVMVEPEEKFG